MGFNETMGNYLIAAQSTLLVLDDFLHRDQRIRDAELNRLLEPFDGDLPAVSLKAALRYIC